MPERPGTDGSEPPVHRPYDRGESTTPDGVMAEPNTLPPHGVHAVHAVHAVRGATRRCADPHREKPP